MSLDAEKTSDKIQYPVMIKIIDKLGGSIIMIILLFFLTVLPRSKLFGILRKALHIVASF